MIGAGDREEDRSGEIRELREHAYAVIPAYNPGPAVAEVCLAAAHELAPDRVLYVGNDALNDMIPARKVGFRTVLFAGDKESLKLRKDRPECASFRADAVIKSLPQLLQIIG